MQTPISNNAIQVAQGNGGEVFFYCQCFICREFESESISVFSVLCQARNKKERQKFQNVLQPMEFSLNLTFFKQLAVRTARADRWQDSLWNLVLSPSCQVKRKGKSNGIPSLAHKLGGWYESNLEDLDSKPCMESGLAVTSACTTLPALSVCTHLACALKYISEMTCHRSLLWFHNRIVYLPSADWWLQRHTNLILFSLRFDVDCQPQPDSPALSLQVLNENGGA